MKGSLKSEVNYLNGAIVRRGEDLGIKTPVNKHLTEIFNEVLKCEGSRKKYSHNPELLEKTIYMG